MKKKFARFSWPENLFKKIEVILFFFFARDKNDKTDKNNPMQIKKRRRLIFILEKKTMQLNVRVGKDDQKQGHHLKMAGRLQQFHVQKRRGCEKP